MIYNGPSLLDGQPIVVIALLNSKNSKTSDMIQTYIIRSDVDPRDANRLGMDYSICGHCPMRGKPNLEKEKGLADNRSCYVIIGQGPLKLYNGYHKGRYPAAIGHTEISKIGKGRMIRIGTYGDGAAVPSYVWDSLCSESKGYTAYSHQKHISSSSFENHRYMVSVQSLDSAKSAWTDGARTFRIVKDQNELVSGKEILCPASKEAGQKTTCMDCGLCAGSSIKAKSIAIVAHGVGANNM